MTLEEFQKTISSNTPPTVKDELVALWYDAKDDWDKAHKIVQDLSTNDAAWVHAYLHRKEGDEANAGYWYRKAGRSFCYSTLKEEWIFIINKLLE